jgi:hypothetical protein
MPRALLTKTLLDEKLSVRPHRQSMLWDTKETGLQVLVSRGPAHKRQATLTFRVAYYLKSNPGKPRYLALDRYDPARTDLADIRDRAGQARIDAQAGNDPKRPKPTGRFADTVAKFIEQHVDYNRSAAETRRIFDVYVTPEWADKNIEEIDKGDVSDLLSRIARGKIEHSGRKVGTPSVARATRAQLITLFNWWDANYGSDMFRSPVRKVMKSDRTLQKSAPRERHLTDDEIRALWTATADMGAYGAAVRTALLTAQRFRKVGAMRRADLKPDHIWDPTRADDPKNKRVSVVPLSPLAQDIINAVPVINARAAKDFVFTTTGTGPIKGWGKYKERLDGKMRELLRAQGVEFQDWQHRDLRRTARTIMASIGIDDVVAEHCLAHAMPLIMRTYNRYDYVDEKRDAFERLAAHIEGIVNPSLPTGNVVSLPTRR